MSDDLIYYSPKTGKPLFREGDYIRIIPTLPHVDFLAHEGYAYFTSDGLLLMKERGYVAIPEEDENFVAHIVMEEIDEAILDDCLLIYYGEENEDER